LFIRCVIPRMTLHEDFGMIDREEHKRLLEEIERLKAENEKLRKEVDKFQRKTAGMYE